MRKILKVYEWIGVFYSRAMLALILLAAGGFMFYGAYHDAAIMDELAHIPAGYGYVRYLDYRLNPEHPPLLKALAASPLLLLQPHFPTDAPAWRTEVNGQWDMGYRFLYTSGNDPDQIIRVARIVPILLTLLFIVLIYAVAKRSLGKFWAIIPALMAGFSPAILAHGHYVTTDIAAAFGILLAIWRFVDLLERPNRRNLWLAGLAFGIAEIMKFSTVLLLPFFAFLALVHWLGRRELSWLKYLKIFVLVLLIGYALVVYPVYALFTVNYPAAKQQADTQFILQSYANGPTPAGEKCHLSRCPADLTIWMAGHKATQPLAEYALGVLMVLQRSEGGNTAYFLGQVSAAGSRLYFPAVFALKESLPELLILFIAFCLALANIFRRLRREKTWPVWREYIRFSFLEFSLLAFIIFYWAYSMKSPLNIGLRHVLPTIPLMYVLAISAWKKWTMRLSVRGQGPLDAMKAVAHSIVRGSLKGALLGALLVWLIIETFLAAPHFLSYFNELGGGTYGGYRFVTDSNYDWGQDLLDLNRFMDSHPEIAKIAVDYFGGGNPAYYLGSRETDWNSAKGDPRAQGIEWLAVSANSLQGAIQPPAAGYDRKPEDSYAWLTALRGRTPGMGGIPEPDYRVGTSIFVYHL